MEHPRVVRPLWALLPLFAVTLASGLAAAEKKPLELIDLMRLRTIQEPVISEDGAWVAYGLWPDRGDGRVVVRSTTGGTEYAIERGKAPRISSDARWVAARIEPTLEEREKSADKKDDEKPKAGLALLATADGSLTTFERVDSFAFSKDGRWLAVHHVREKAEGAKEEEEPAGEPTAAAGTAATAETPPAAEPPPATSEPGGEESAKEKEEKKKDENVGATLVLRQLAEGVDVEIPHVTAYAFAETGGFLAYAVAEPGGEENGIFVRLLDEPDAPELAIRQDPRGRYTALAWPEKAATLAFVAAVDDEEGEPGDGTLWIWDGEHRAARQAASSATAPDGWFLPSVNELTWTKDGARLYFGFKPLDEKVAKKKKHDEGGEAAPFDPYDVDAILEDRGVDVWGWDDPLIIPHQKERWKEEKDRSYRAVYHPASGDVVPLADRTVRTVTTNQSPTAALAEADVPYLKLITWDGRYRDVYRVDLADGSRQLVAEKLRDDAEISPGGRYVVYYREPHWYLFDGESGTTRNLTEALAVPFADEDHDYPMPAPGYGVAGWVEGDAAVLLYDKYDLWQFPTAGGEALRLTDGREKKWIFRLLDLDEERDFLHPDEPLLLSVYDDRLKSRGFAGGRVGRPGTRSLLGGDTKLTFVGKAKHAGRLLYTRESYTEFPDLWVAGLELEGPHKVSDANPEIADFAWGSAELVDWRSDDGVPLQGVLIRPGNYRPGERYPVLVYFYRFMSQRLYDFNEPVVNHRPSFPFYASHGYAIFLPDIRFEIGRPGLSAVKCLVPGVHKLIDMGIADPEAIGLHGHSWSGYQTAFIVTQTDLFAAAVAGAPVSNMTSAYGGIRWGSGLARQFQYEQSQSRLGTTLWQGRDRYLDNSPLFFADRVATPLLIMFGDADDAVPWYQGIELYLALRRLGKESFFLEYRGEPHHLEKYANKLDYTIKMKEFFDHYLKGEPAPPWMREGVPYRGE